MQLQKIVINRQKLTGFCLKPVSELVSEFLSGNVTSYGDYTLALEGNFENEQITLLYSSQIAATPYYYTITGNNIYHGNNIFSVWKESGIAWNWDTKALYGINNMEHSSGDLSLHAEIKRMPAHSCLVFFQGKIHITGYEDLLLKKNRPISIEEAIEKYISFTADYCSTGKDSFISLSAGLDSRLILATLLYHNNFPRVATMGFENSTDVKTAVKIAKDFNLQHTHHELNVVDYFNERKITDIINQTSGSKTVRHWHTYFFINHFKDLTNTLHFAGSNGELVRSYYFDKGILARILNSINGSLFQSYISAKLNRGNQYVINSLKSLKSVVEEDILTDAPTLPFMERLNHFYSCQRVRHFIGNGIALYNDSFPTALPFLDERFIRIATQLPINYKFNSLFHKSCIKALKPRLLDYPNFENTLNIRNTNTNTYFLRKNQINDYDISKEVFSHSFMKEIIFESPCLDEWVTKKEREVYWLSGKIRTLSFLATLHHISNNIQSLKPV